MNDRHVRVTDDAFQALVSDRLAVMREYVVRPETVQKFEDHLRAASKRQSFVCERAMETWLTYMVDHYMAAQCPGECAQHSMLILTQSSLQAFLSVRHSVLDNSLVARFQGSLVPHISKNVLSPVKHSDACTMLVCPLPSVRRTDGDNDGDDELGSTIAVASRLAMRTASHFNASDNPANVRLLRSAGEARPMWIVASMLAPELVSAQAPLHDFCLQWTLDPNRCYEANMWPSEIATLWNHSHGDRCFAVASARPFAVTLFLCAKSTAESAQIIRERFCPRGAATASAHHFQHDALVVRRVVSCAGEYMSLPCNPKDGTTAATDLQDLLDREPMARDFVLLRFCFFPKLWALHVCGVHGIGRAWPARYTCPISKAPGDGRRWCVKTAGSAFHVVHRSFSCVPNGGLLDRDTLATDDLSSDGMQLLGVDTAVAYLCHEEVARANDVHAEHLFTLGMVLSHNGILGNVSGKGYSKLGCDFGAQIAVEDIRSALQFAALGVSPVRNGNNNKQQQQRLISGMSKATAIMLGRQTCDGTNVSGVMWRPAPGPVQTQTQIANADPGHYGEARPALARIVARMDTQRSRHRETGGRKTSRCGDDDGRGGGGGGDSDAELPSPRARRVRTMLNAIKLPCENDEEDAGQRQRTAAAEAQEATRSSSLPPPPHPLPWQPHVAASARTGQ